MICLLFLFPFLFEEREQKLYTIQGFAQGTSYNLRYYASSELVFKKDVDSILQEIDASMSLYKPGSLINKFNRSGTGISLDPGFQQVVQKSFEIYKATKGRFDITVAPLVQLWGFGPLKQNRFPDSATVQQTLKKVGMQQLRLKGNQLRKLNPEVQIDLNGIAQGYSADVLAGFLQEKGLQSYMVEIGGEVVAKGNKPDGSGYRIGIDGPSANGYVVALKEGAITTSGNYNKYLNYKDRKISHLINPKTGYPLDNVMISVTVYAKDAITADGYDNALMAMEIKEAMAFTRKAHLEAYFIYRRPDGSLADTLTNGFKELLIH